MSNQHHLKCEYMNCDRLDATKRGAFTLCAPHHVAVARARGDGEILRGPPRARMLVIEKKAKMHRLAQKVLKRQGLVKSNEQIRSEATLTAVSERALDAVMPNVFRAAPGLRELAATAFGQVLARLLAPEAPQPMTTMTVDARWDDFLEAWHQLACAIDWTCPRCGCGMNDPVSMATR